jgi:hypothetical protein
MTDKMPPLPYPQMPGSDYSAADMHQYARRYALMLLQRAYHGPSGYREVDRRLWDEIQRLRGAG